MLIPFGYIPLENGLGVFISYDSQEEIRGLKRLSKDKAINVEFNMDENTKLLILKIGDLVLFFDDYTMNILCKTPTLFIFLKKSDDLIAKEYLSFELDRDRLIEARAILKYVSQKKSEKDTANASEISQ